MMFQKIVMKGYYSALLFVIFCLAQCIPINYVETFQVGKISELYKLKGKVKSVRDTIYEYIYLRQSDEYFLNKESGTEILSLEVSQEGYPTKVKQKIADKIVLEYTVNSNRHIKTVQANVDGIPYNALVSYPQEYGYKIQSNSIQKQFIHIIEEIFNPDYSHKKRTVWDYITQIGVTDVYGETKSVGETFSQTKEVLANDILDKTELITYDKNMLPTKIESTEVKTKNVITTSYVYEKIDAQGNYTDKIESKNSIRKYSVQRTIVYYP